MAAGGPADPVGRDRAHAARVVGSLVVALVALAVLAGTASAFDTGPHFDITEDVLRSEGFSDGAIATVQSANFLVDFYEFIGNPALEYALDQTCRVPMLPVLTVADKQHFDDLHSTLEVANQWDAMLAATKSTAEAKRNAGDVFGLLALLGASLHNVQDFYSHSNWADGGTTGPPLGRGPLAKYGSHPTWLSMDRADRMALDVYTKCDRKAGPPGNLPACKRSHGDWDSKPDALNQDWAGRPHYRDAYVCAFFATRQWVRLFRDFVGQSGVWTSMQQWSAPPKRDRYYAERISFYGGHWNGNGGPTGLDAFSSRTAGTTPALLLNAVTTYMHGLCLTRGRSKMRKEIESLLLTWGAAPNRGAVQVTLPSAAPDSLQFAALQVLRIHNVNADDGFGGGDMDWYSKAQIGGQLYLSGLIDEHDNFDFKKSPYAPWTMIKEVAPVRSNVPIVFKLMELDYSEDDLVDINPSDGISSLVFNYSLKTGKVDGSVTGSPTFTVQGRGDCDCARLDMELSSFTGSSR